MVNIILEPHLVLPILVPNMPQKKSRNGAMNSIVLRLCKNTTTCRLFSIYKRYLKSIYLLYENNTRHDGDVIKLELLPTLLNSVVPEVDRQLYSLQLRHGGLGIPILSENAEFQFEASQAITLIFVTIIIIQSNALPNKTEVNEIKRKITNVREVRISEQALKVE